MLLISDLHIIIIFSLSFFVHECVHVMRGKSWKYHFFTCTMQEFSGSMNCPFSDSSAKFLFSDSSEVSSFPFSYFLHPLSLSLSLLLCVLVCLCYPGKHHFLHALCKNLVVTWTVLFLTQVIYHNIIWCSGSIQWEVKLEGRIESSAAIVGDFSQVDLTVYNLRCCFIIFSIAWALLIFSICHVLSGCSWLLQWENIFSWFSWWQHLLDFPNMWWGMMI